MQAIAMIGMMADRTQKESRTMMLPRRHGLRDVVNGRKWMASRMEIVPFEIFCLALDVMEHRTQIGLESIHNSFFAHPIIAFQISKRSSLAYHSW